MSDPAKKETEDQMSRTTAKLKILHLEDSPTDAELVSRFLSRGGMDCEIKFVDNRINFEKQLDEFCPDIILSDHSLPQFNSIEALKIARAQKPDIPFILVTGTVSEEFAVDCIRNGADDYILKSNLLRLPAAIRNSIKEKMAQVRLRESEERYRLIVETAHEGICMFDRDFKTIFVNKELCDILEYTREELVGRKFTSCVDQDFKTAAMQAMVEGARRIELKCATRTGRRIWVEVSTSPVKKDGRFIGILGMVSDITERKIAHEKLVQSEKQIRNFANHLNKTMEVERARIAREMHDELGQQLAGIKMSLAACRRLQDEEKRAEKVQAMVNDVDSTIQTMRKIATELRPGILDTLGLIPSIEWLINEFERKTSVKCEKRVDVRDAKFDNEISICFFRVCQESLTNISKHAEASKVKVAVEQRDGELIMTVADNGKGIAGEELDNPFSMGLLGMRERANLIGAELNLMSSPNKGTTVELRATLK